MSAAYIDSGDIPAPVARIWFPDGRSQDIRTFPSREGDIRYADPSSPVYFSPVAGGRVVATVYTPDATVVQVPRRVAITKSQGEYFAGYGVDDNVSARAEGLGSSAYFLQAGGKAEMRQALMVPMKVYQKNSDGTVSLSIVLMSMDAQNPNPTQTPWMFYELYHGTYGDEGQVPFMQFASMPENREDGLNPFTFGALTWEQPTKPILVGVKQYPFSVLRTFQVAMPENTTTCTFLPSDSPTEVRILYTTRKDANTSQLHYGYLSHDNPPQLIEIKKPWGELSGLPVNGLYAMKRLDGKYGVFLQRGRQVTRTTVEIGVDAQSDLDTVVYVPDVRK